MGDRSLDEFTQDGDSGSETDETRGESDRVEDTSDEDSRQQVVESTVDESARGVESASDGSASGESTQDLESERDGPEQAVEPAVSTSHWNAAGMDCPSCGTSVSRLWIGPDQPVCGSCKEW